MSRDQHLITLALAVLNEAAYRSRTQVVAGAPVRLALRVLLPYVDDRAGLIAFWHAAHAASVHVESPCRHPYHMIAKALRDRGWDAPV